MLQDVDLVKIGIEVLGPLFALVALIVRLHSKNVERFHVLDASHQVAREHLQRISDQLDHQDKCIDDLKREAVSSARGNSDLARRVDIEAELTRIRAAISSEISRTIGNFDTRLREIAGRLSTLEARAMRNMRGDE